MYEHVVQNTTHVFMYTIYTKVSGNYIYLCNLNSIYLFKYVTFPLTDPDIFLHLQKPWCKKARQDKALKLWESIDIEKLRIFKESYN